MKCIKTLYQIKLLGILVNLPPHISLLQLQYLNFFGGKSSPIALASQDLLQQTGSHIVPSGYEKSFQPEALDNTIKGI